jgi:hypothetical protein
VEEKKKEEREVTKVQKILLLNLDFLIKNLPVDFLNPQLLPSVLDAAVALTSFEMEN